ncbi:uncharacterized protein [Littorina saxatilis]|uniref:EF-hand domain-containing protein n=1 Tax=Littorina saxatilis TaxID=31220 RepID=A0AAN9G5D2_9CAEN
MKTVVLIGVLCVLSVEGQTVAPELAKFMAQVRSIVEQLFGRADVNHNGRFDLQDLGNVFQEYDTDGDNEVTKTEFITRFANNSNFLLPVARGLFFDLDMDKNGQLEARDTQLYFDKIDHNDDGQVDHQEFVNYFTQLFQVLFIVAIKADQAIPGN